MTADTDYKIKVAFAKSLKDPPEARIRECLYQMIDDKQFKSLLAWMTQYKNNTKFIVTSVPFVGVVKNPGQDKWCSPAYTAQREKILGHILKNGISNVVFLTGDMHTSYCADMEISDSNGNRVVIQELMSSPINQFTPDLPLEFYYAPPSQNPTVDFTTNPRSGKTPTMGLTRTS